MTLQLNGSALRPRRCTHARAHQLQVAKLSEIMAGRQRIFTSPIPPTMSRHGLRCLLFWLLALPILLTGSVPPLVNAAWTAATAFIYLGIDELGVQVIEQPFQIIPLWQICQAAQDDVLHTLASPDRPQLSDSSDCARSLQHSLERGLEG